MCGWCKGARGARDVGSTGLPMVILSERSQCTPTSDQVSLISKELFEKHYQQECIPVGCVSPAAVAIGGVSTRYPLGAGTSPEQAPPWTRTLPGPGIPLGPGTLPGTRHPMEHPPKQTPPKSRHHPPPGPSTSRTRQMVDRHTPVNILPCPKFCLRAVNI